jgi:hypothetical protein
MDYGTLRTQFKELLNRNDCTDELADRFLEMGLRRVERLLRTPLQHQKLEVEILEGGLNTFPVPTDYLGMHHVLVNGKILPRVAKTQIEHFSGWYLEDASIRFSTSLKEGDDLEIIYYNEFLFPAAGDTDLTEYTVVIPDIIMYAGMVFACTFFIDDRKSEFQADLSALIQEIQMMTMEDEMSGTGMQVTPIGGGIV